MIERYGPFAALWRAEAEAFPPSATEERVPGHLPLLGLYACDRALAIVRRAAGEPGADQAIGAMLAEANWRPNLVAAVAVMFGRADGRHAAATWEALDAASWVSPQLAVALSEHDLGFVEAAVARISSGCPTSPRNWGAKAAGQPNAKAASALVAVLEAVAPERVPARTPALDALLAADVDGGGRIAVGWRRRFLEHAVRLGADQP